MTSSHLGHFISGIQKLEILRDEISKKEMDLSREFKKRDGIICERNFEVLKMRRMEAITLPTRHGVTRRIRDNE